MSWLENQVAQHGEKFEEQLIQVLDLSGVYSTVFQLCGPFGVRRFILRFEYQVRGLTISELENLPLHYGGGSPTAATRDNLEQVRTSLAELHSKMSEWAPWKKGLLSIVRDCDNQIQVIPFFDEDCALISVEHLPMPPQGHPLEGREYLQLQGSLQAQLEPVYLNTQAISHDWTEWAIDEEMLTLLYAEQYGQEVERKRCQVLATFDASGVWSWQVSEPLFSEDVFCWEGFVCDWEAAVELGMVCVARLKGAWLFFSLVSEEPQVTLFVAVWD